MLPGAWEKPLQSGAFISTSSLPPAELTSAGRAAEFGVKKELEMSRGGFSVMWNPWLLLKSVLAVKVPASPLAIARAPGALLSPGSGSVPPLCATPVCQAGGGTDTGCHLPMSRGPKCLGRL